MSDRGRRPRGRRLVAAVVDAVTYALLAAVLATGVAALVSLPLGFGLVGVKYALFYLGFLVFAIAVVVSWPGSAWQDVDLSFGLLTRGPSEDDEPTVPWVDTAPSGRSGEPEQTPFQATVQAVPPARLVPAPPSDRLPTGLRLFLAALAIHATSLALETVFGVPG